jgi:type IV pilus assembly protein PilQ
MYQDKNMNRRFAVTRGQWLVAILLLGLVTGIAWTAQTSAPAPDPNAAASGETIDANQAQVDFSNGCLIKFIAFQKDSNIRDGLRLLAVLCKKNIVPSSRVDGPLTISRLYNVTFEDALKSILGYGFKYEQDGDFVRVYTTEEFKQIKEDPERMVHKAIPLYYVKAEEMEKLVKPVLSNKAVVAKSTPLESAISGASSAGGTSSGLTVSGKADDLASPDMLVIFDYPENIERAEALVREVDVRPKQVLVEATILSARLNDETQFGIDWNLLSGVAVTGYPSTLVGGQGTPVQTFGFAGPASGRGLTAGISADNVQAIVTALEEVTDTTLLANPKILAVNKQEGQVLIGKKLGYIDTTSQNLTSTTQSVAFLNTGTQLVFRPYIADDGYIRMQIYPKDSDGIVKENGIPDETTTELCTNVIVKDGETIVIGGLFRDSVVTSRSQVPLLGDIPFVGVVFRGTRDTVVHEEVIIMLTPHIIKDAADTNPDKRLKDLRLKSQGAEDGLQIIDRAKIAAEAYDSAARYYLEGDMEKALFNLKIALHEQPTYLEALRLRERIIAETDPEQYKKLDSIVKQEVGQQDEEGWVR